MSFGGSPTIAATAIAVLQVQGLPTISAGGAGFAIGDTVNFGSSLVMLVTNVAAGAITAWSVQSAGYISSGSVPANPFNQISTSGSGTGANLCDLGCGSGGCDWRRCWLWVFPSVIFPLAQRRLLPISAQHQMAFPLSRDLFSRGCSSVGSLVLPRLSISRGRDRISTLISPSQLGRMIQSQQRLFLGL